MTVPAHVTVPMGPWLWPAGACFLGAAMLLVWSYRRSPRSDAAHRVAFTLKLLGVLILASCLPEPLWSGRRAKSGANLFAIAADNSSGMTIHDTAEEQSRGQILQSLLEAGKTSWLAALSETFQLRQYVFDSRLRRTTDFSDLAFDGKATAIGAALQTLADRYQGRPLAGILLLTDGCATDIGEPLPNLSRLPPVYPVMMGRDRPQKDIRLANVTVSQTSFEDAPVTVQADVEATGSGGRTVAVDLLDESGNQLERRPWRIDRNDDKQVFRFRLRPDRTGLLFYQLRVIEPSGDDVPAEREMTWEATLANNKRTVVVDRGKGPYRILYVSGRPNWEFKFLRRALEEDEQVQLVGLIRVARREPKYDWRGRAGETSNPLYRGFEPSNEEEAEQYDQPVLVRLNTRDEAELRGGFPSTAEDLFDYHAVILDDVEAGFFTYDQMDLLRRFVTERGGGFLMLGGKESFRQGEFERTPIGSILPIYLDPMPPDVPSAPARLQLTREGWLQPWARLRDNEQDERQRLSQMPAFRVLNRTRAVKPGARVVALSGTEGEPQFPALVVQQFGNGRSAALTLGDIWRWGLRNEEMRADMEKFWRQTGRWLVADVPERISLQARHHPGGTGRAMKLQLRVRDERFKPVDGASVTMTVREPAEHEVSLTASPVLTERGLYEAVYVPRVSGGYFATATVAHAGDIGTDNAETAWTTDLEAAEFQSVKPNRALLEKIARRTGGRLLQADGLDGFVRSLPHRDAPITEVWVVPLWDRPGMLPAILLTVLGCLVAEWAIRRWKGIP